MDEITNTANTLPYNMKYCKFCGAQIHAEAVMCPKCGCQVEELKSQQPIIINNSASSSASAAASSSASANQQYRGIPKNKWVAFFLCLFLGIFGAHKFYEGKIGMGILYLCTFGLCCIGWIVDLLAILGKPQIYYVY